MITCNYCGNNDETRFSLLGGLGRILTWVRCRNCGCDTAVDTLDLEPEDEDKWWESEDDYAVSEMTRMGDTSR